jgi:hypothetical protein
MDSCRPVGWAIGYVPNGVVVEADTGPRMYFFRIAGQWKLAVFAESGD